MTSALGDILVAGGGIGGITAALCLAQQGFNVRVFEQSAEFTEVGAGIQLSPNCSRVLHSLGMAEALAPIVFLPDGVEMRAWRSGQLISTSRLGTNVRETYGSPYYHVHRADLMAVLLDAARSDARIQLHTHARVDCVRQSQDAVVVEVDGREHMGAALVGADGIRSLVRTTLFGEESPSFTGNVAWRALVPANSLPKGLVRPMATAWWGPGKHFVHYYVRGGALVNCVCVVEKSGWEVESWTERGDIAELKRDFAGWHADLQLLIAAMDADRCYKWALFDRGPMANWSRGRMTLLGDACHPTLPFMAQGAAMAIEDAAVLSRCLAAGVLRDREVPQSLLAYENLRRARTARIQAGSRRNAKVFHLRGVSAWMRNRVARRAGDQMMHWLYGYDALGAAAVAVSDESDERP